MFESPMHKSDGPSGLGDLLEDALLQARNLVQAELTLARAELKGELKVAVASVLMLVTAAMFLQAGIVVFGVVLVVAWGASAASYVVVAALLAVGVALALLALRGLAKDHLVQTAARLSTDAKQLMETAK